MGGFCMFYRLLVAQMASNYPFKTASGVPAVLNPLPRVTARTRSSIVDEIDQRGAEAFIRDAIQALENDNPELLQMAHFFASEQDNYRGIIQGFALLYAALAIQSSIDRLSVH
jgi:hypothetical protein